MILLNGYPVKYFIFPGGEVQVKLPEKVILGDTNDIMIIKARIKNSNDFMALLLTSQAIDDTFGEKIKRLKLNYLPYARQDRACWFGEANSLALISKLLSQAFDKIDVLDVHNPNVLDDKFINASMNDFIDIHSYEILEGIDLLVAPDIGAIERVSNISYLVDIPYFPCNKVRDHDGKILHHDLKCMIKDQNLMVIDDICDGGATFISLANLFREKGAISWKLFVTHGIFSKGIEPLLDAGYEMIYTTDSFYEGESTDKLKVFEI